MKLAEYYAGEGAVDAVRIEIPKGSYRPVARVMKAEQAVQPQPETSALRGNPWRFLIWATVPVLALAAVGALAWRLTTAHAHRPKRVAVLPFRDDSPRREWNAFADGLRDGITSALVHTPGLEVTARMSSGQQRDANRSVLDVARRIGAETIVSGSISPTGNEFQVVVNLIDGSSGKYLWSKTYRASGTELADIERSAAAGVAAALGASTDVPEVDLPHNPEALDLYLRASSLYRSRQPADMREAAGLFEHVIRLEPNFAPAYAAAANNSFVAIWNGGVLKWNDVGTRAMELAQRAMQLDPTLADAHAALAQGFLDQWKWREGEEEISRAIELDRRSPLAYYRKAFVLALERRFAEAERAIETARTLDPAWGSSTCLLGEIYYYERRYDEVLGFAQRWRQVNPAFFDELVGRAYLIEGRPDLARPYRAKLPFAWTHAELRGMDGDPRGGYQELLDLHRRSAVSDVGIAGFAINIMHDRALTLDWLERSLRDHEPDLVSIAFEPGFDPIRSDPRAAKVLRTMNLDGRGSDKK